MVVLPLHAQLFYSIYVVVVLLLASLSSGVRLAIVTVVFFFVFSFLIFTHYVMITHHIECYTYLKGIFACSFSCRL